MTTAIEGKNLCFDYKETNILFNTQISEGLTVNFLSLLIPVARALSLKQRNRIE